ncbi:hypothetical protein PAMP_000682 [Pampus punctatissimus]
MFNRKPRRNFRQRKGESSDEEEEQHNCGDGRESKKAAVMANKPSKVAHSRGISCSSKREATPPKPDSSDGEGGEKLELTAEKEERRKDKDGLKNKINTVLSFSEDKEALEPEFRLKKSSDKAVLFQVRRKEAPPARTTHSTVRAGGAVPPSGSPRQDYGSQASPHNLHQSDDNEDEDDDEDEEEEEGGSSSSSSSSDSNYSATKPVVIPNAKEIKAARRQRQATRARKEFIPLSKDGQSSPGSTPDPYSRDDDDEDRVDDDDDEPDDHERRIEFAPRLKSIRERIAMKLGESEGSLLGSDEEEQELWEETQIGKGVKRRPGGQSPSGSESSSYSYSSSSSNNRRDRQRLNKKSAGVNIPETLPFITVSMVKRRITGKLASLKEVHRARRAELSRMEGDVESAKTSAETLEESSSESQLKFYRAMTFYAHNMVECLREKARD